MVGPGDIFRQVPERKRNEELRSREYLTPAEIDKLIKAAKEGRWGLRDATLILVACRHGLRAKEAAELECGPGKAREAIGEASPNGAVSMNDGFVVFRCPIVAQDIPIGGVDIGDDLDILRQEQKLFSHFGEAGTAIFLIQEIQYGGHNPIPVVLTDTTVAAHRIVSGGFRRSQKMASSAGKIVSLQER